MAENTSIRCSNCGTITSNSDYCSNCGALINVHLKRKMEWEKKEQQKLQDEKEKTPSKLSSFFQRALEHPNILIRSFTKGIYSIWMFFGMLVGAIIAAVLALVSG